MPRWSATDRPPPPVPMDRDHAVEPPQATQTLFFTDRRPPQDIQWQLERDLMEVLAPVPGAGKYTLEATMPHGTQRFGFRLVLESVAEGSCSYTLQVTLSDPGPRPSTPEELAKTLASWLGFWGRNFVVADPSTAAAFPGARYDQVVEEARRAEAHLVEVPALQQEILRRMREGWTFRTSHKEGGTTISYRRGRWSRVDFGEWSTTEHFATESSFLAFLRRFFDGEVSRNVAPAKVPEEKAWRLILRLLQDVRDIGPGGVRRASPGVVVWAMLTATSMILAMAKVRIAVRGRAPLPALDAVFYPSLGVLGVCVLVAAIWMRRNWP